MKQMEKDFGFFIAHIGINRENEEAALATAELLQKIFGFSYKVGNSSVFSADKKIEIMKKMYRGTNGHIAVGTTDIEGAVAYLKNQGVALAEETAVVKNGSLTAIYLAEEIAGFAIHLVQA